MGIPVVDQLVALLGPFLLPVLLFGLGLVGYLVLLALGRAGLDVSKE